MKFRKKPIVIEAIQWTGENPDAVIAFLRDQSLEWDRKEAFTIYTLEGNMRADKDDWIIKGVKGEFYPCKPDIFSATYEEVV